MMVDAGKILDTCLKFTEKAVGHFRDVRRSKSEWAALVSYTTVLLGPVRELCLLGAECDQPDVFLSYSLTRANAHAMYRFIGEFSKTQGLLDALVAADQEAVDASTKAKAEETSKDRQLFAMAAWKKGGTIATALAVAGKLPQEEPTKKEEVAEAKTGEAMDVSAHIHDVDAANATLAAHIHVLEISLHALSEKLKKAGKILPHEAVDRHVTHSQKHLGVEDSSIDNDNNPPTKADLTGAH